MTQPVITLARVEEWRADVMDPFGHESPSDLLEIAFDQETAERAWRENVPRDLPQRSGEPQSPGLYAPFEDVDFDTHAVAVWSSGQSGECAAWVHDISSDKMRPTVFETEDAQQDCTDDFNDYSLVLAVERSRLPKKSRLPLDDALAFSMTLSPSVNQSPDAVIDVYPATGWPSDRVD